MTVARQNARRLFLEASGFGRCKPVLLAGDASNRRYERLHEPAGGKTYVLMDAPPEKGEDTRPFTHIAQHLLGCGLSAPEILAADHHNGFLVLEDFGDALFSSLLRESPAREQPLYEHAASALVALHKADQPDQVPVYGPAEMADLAVLAADWYASALADADPGALRAQLTDEIQHLLEAAPQMPPVLVLRDFHSDNLIWLPKRAGPAKVGLLDFQDAAIGNPAYDVVSLTDDVRRDVSPQTRDAVFGFYCAETGTDPAEFAHAAALCSLQRLLRIVGVFARLCLRDGKPGYLPFLPRVFSLIDRCLTHPATASVAPLIRAGLPNPAPDVLKILRDRCK